jgi:hypothetical protein
MLLLCPTDSFSKDMQMIVKVSMATEINLKTIRTHRTWVLAIKQVQRHSMISKGIGASLARMGLLEQALLDL